ncbi:MAG: hypothetical protein HRT61_07785 [Ekhidna sp.]|nr:hypothetical protein [Ekhidna sp.]
MDEVTLVRTSYQLIRKDFGLEEDILFEQEQIDFDRLLVLLTNRVSYLLDHDFNALLNALYRIDLSENLIKELLHSSKSEELAQNISMAIIERQKRKVLTRRYYTP